MGLLDLIKKHGRYVNKNGLGRSYWEVPVDVAMTLKPDENIPCYTRCNGDYVQAMSLEDE